MSAARRLIVSAAVLPLLALGACSDDPAPEDVGAAPEPDAVEIVGLQGTVTVEGAYGTEPEVEVDAPFAVSRTEVEVMAEGDGAVVADDSDVRIDMLGVVGRDGTVFDNTWSDSTPRTVGLDGQVIDGFAEGLVGQTVGSRVVIAVAPQDGYTDGLGPIRPGDSLVLVVDLLDPDV